MVEPLKNYFRQKRETQLTSVLMLLLSLAAMYQLFAVGERLYITDIIGRTLRISSIELSQGHPIYSAPALAMSYTPGYVLLNAVAFKLFGFSYTLWNVIWVVGSLLCLAIVSFVVWRNDRILAPFIPAALLACLFPFIWARGDIYALLLLFIGMAVLDPIGGNRTVYREVVASLLLALAIFFKQTLLPAIVAVVILSCKSEDGYRKQFVCTTKIVAAMSVLFLLLMLFYMWAYHESLESVISVLTIGKHHHIRLQNVLFYGAMYLLILIPATLYVLSIASHEKYRVTVLLVLGVPYVFFSAKDGGGWHHFLSFLVPWLWFVLKIRRENETSVRTSRNAGAYWIITMVMLLAAYAYFPFRPGIAHKSDIAAVDELMRLQVNSGPGANRKVLFLDSADGFAYPEIAYSRGLQPLYDRGAMEELTGAFNRIPQSLLDAIHSQSFAMVILRKGNDVGMTAYGIPYAPMYEKIQASYSACEGVKMSYWNVLCPSNKE